MEIPPGVRAAHERAEAQGFTMSCAPGFGRFLATLAAAVPAGGRVLELGTGTGAGVEWILHGLGARTDVQVATVELDGDRARAARALGWPGFVEVVEGDGAELVTALGRFDLVFADAPGGKLHNLDGTIDALKVGGVLVVDDMDPGLHGDPALVAAISRVRQQLLAHPDLVTAEVGVTTGAVVAVQCAT